MSAEVASSLAAVDAGMKARAARGWFVLLVTALIAIQGPSCRFGPRYRETDAGRLGRVELFAPASSPRALVFLFSDSAGWSAAHQQAAAALAEIGAVVVGVDLTQYFAGLAASDDGCHYVVAELEDMSERLQREFGFHGYASPILAGNGEGGTLAYAALAQAPAATIGGAVSIDPTTVLHTKVALCEGAPVRAASGGGFAYGAGRELPGWWRVVDGGHLPAELRSMAAETGAGVAALGGDLSSRIVEALRPLIAGEAERVHGLSIVEIPASQAGDLMAVIYSGDGGWRDLDKQIGEVLAHEGVPVVGMDSLRYFWRARTPEQTAADLAEILRQYGTKWKTERVLLIGYSFGAGILPFAFNRLPEEYQRRVVDISLLGLESRAPFEISLSGWFKAGAPADAPEVLPELRRIDLKRVQCFFGEEEEDTLCRHEELARAEVIRTKGGHHFDGDYRALARRILDGGRRRLGKTPRGASG
jgi:type IV secretory pathway VirJ component